MLLYVYIMCVYYGYVYIWLKVTEDAEKKWHCTIVLSCTLLLQIRELRIYGFYLSLVLFCSVYSITPLSFSTCCFCLLCVPGLEIRGLVLK